MKPHKLKSQARQLGVTLLELSVILIILVALAGLMVPDYSVGIKTSIQDSTGVSSLAEMDKLIQVYNTRYLKEPNNMEALINRVAGSNSLTDINCTGVAINTLYCKIVCTGCFMPLTLALEGLASLNIAGITSLYYNDPNTADATFASTVTPEVLLSLTSVVAQVVVPGGATLEDYLAAVFGSTSKKFDTNCYDYVAFGVGNQSSSTGTVMSTAPVYFSDHPDTGPVAKYNRFIAIYQVDRTPVASPASAMRKGCSSGIEAAKFMGSVIAGDRPNGPLIGLANTQLRSAENAANSR